MNLKRLLAPLLILLCVGLAFADPGMGPGPGVTALAVKHVVQTNNAYFSSSPATIHFTTQNTTASNAIIVIVSLYNGSGTGNTLTVTDTTDSVTINPETNFPLTQGGASTVFVGSYYNITGGTEDTIEVTATNTVSQGLVSILEVSGLLTNGQDITQSTGSSTATAVTIGPHTPAQASELYISALTVVNAAGLNAFPLSGYNDIANNTSGAGQWDQSYKIATVGGALTNNYGNLSSGNKWALGMVTYK